MAHHVPALSSIRPRPSQEAMSPEPIYYYVAKRQGIDTTLVYSDETGRIVLWRNAHAAETVAEDIGPGWEPVSLPRLKP
jgi:hypothetical protein